MQSKEEFIDEIKALVVTFIDMVFVFFGTIFYIAFIYVALGIEWVKISKIPFSVSFSLILYLIDIGLSKLFRIKNDPRRIKW